jgi:uncharacterized protein (TIGR00730 family)
MNNDLQRQSASYRLAALDQDFILGDSTRGVRFLLEYAKAEERLRGWGVLSTIVVFGSARARPGVAAGAQPAASAPSAQALSRQIERTARWYDEARRFGRIASERGGALLSRRAGRRNVIATGGGGGIMEAANRGAFDAGAPSIGFNIRLPAEQQPNGYSTPDLTFQFHYFAMRKMHLAMRAAALVVFPGGFGTLDELFEILTLAQTRKAPNVPIVCFDRAYWTRVVNFEALLQEGMISASDLGLFSFADDAEEAWKCLVDRGLSTVVPPDDEGPDR